MLLLNIHSIGKPTIYQTIFSLLLLKKEESPIRNLSTNFLIRNAFYSQYEPHLCQFVSIIFHFYQPSMQKTQMVVIIKKKKKNSSFMTHFSCSRYSDMPQHVWWIGVIFAAFYLGHPTSTLQSFWGCFFFFAMVFTGPPYLDTYINQGHRLLWLTRAFSWNTLRNRF